MFRTAAALLLTLPSFVAFADGAVPPQPTLDAAAARAFPQAVFDKVVAKITAQATLMQMTPAGLVRWQPRTITLVVFVKAPSQTYADTYLYAMRYAVAVLSEKDTLAVHETSCQAVVVYKHGEYDDPTVVCEPLILNPTGEDS
jgi:hypothetical protein